MNSSLNVKIMCVWWLSYVHRWKKFSIILYISLYMKQNFNVMSDVEFSTSVIMMNLRFDFWSILDLGVWVRHGHPVYRVRTLGIVEFAGRLLGTVGFFFPGHTACLEGCVGIVENPQLSSVSPVVYPPVSALFLSSDSVLDPAASSGILSSEILAEPCFRESWVMTWLISHRLVIVLFL